MSKITDYWSFFAGEARRIASPLYAHLAEGIGADEELKALAARAKKGQPQANMILGAAHFLLLRGADHPLKEYYASVGGTRTLADGDPFPLFADFVAGHKDALLPLIETRATNTNEAGRSAMLHPGFRVAAGDAQAPLALIEIGPSAGLNMIWDRYGVRYRRDGNIVAEIAPDARLVIDCDLKGEAVPPTGPTPAVASRLGLELNPNDLSDRDNRDWLRALVWPEHVARLQRLDAAIALRLEEKPQMIFGDALENLLDAIRAIPPAHAVCVYHTIAIYQFSPQMKQTLDDLITVAALRRPVFRLGFEFGGEGRHPVTLKRYQDGAAQEKMLADAHPHGGWIEWLA